MHFFFRFFNSQQSFLNEVEAQEPRQDEIGESAAETADGERDGVPGESGRTPFAGITQEKSGLLVIFSRVEL